MISPTVRPSQQGPLDNPCGIYSLAIAIASLFHDVPNFTRKALKMVPLRELAQGCSLDDLLDAAVMRSAFGWVSKRQSEDQNPLSSEGEIQP